MTPLRDTPIKGKLTAITMLTSGVALLLACVAFVTYELTGVPYQYSRRAVDHGGDRRRQQRRSACVRRS